MRNATTSDGVSTHFANYVRLSSFRGAAGEGLGSGKQHTIFRLEWKICQRLFCQKEGGKKYLTYDLPALLGGVVFQSPKS